MRTIFLSNNRSNVAHMIERTYPIAYHRTVVGFYNLYHVMESTPFATVSPDILRQIMPGVSGEASIGTGELTLYDLKTIEHIAAKKKGSWIL